MTKPIKLSEKNKHFFDMVYDTVKQIPHGRVTSYGAVARFLGSGQSARMVGWAMNNTHKQPFDIAAHRVVNRVGALTGKNHFSNPTRMQELLESEGIKVIEDQVVEFEKHFWDPTIELGID